MAGDVKERTLVSLVDDTLMGYGKEERNRFEMHEGLVGVKRREENQRVPQTLRGGPNDHYGGRKRR